ncbi:carboxypeptidase-like regulatory domain-containing protein [Hymenobacter sp. ASUV-10]|uniref:Carboxypeptidase-like regulatory domain-containing protein n=1 Tax=Hymenobacter aranciens TaxID=3063996 RepID=A0ABT9B968_9BACT|nr:carboxypeptidase-like regulatory domain-containing protein [Hymenobacter sp. ASUV-10]MDO7874269.1 carboxypeptidase-like regulatory domain-containing protein [Hymenobacter sp. ASUV-10]
MRLLLLFAALAVIFTLPATAQQRLAQARQRSYLTKVFRLTEAQTRHLYEHGINHARPEFFTQPVDSFPTDSLRPRPLPVGYYLVAHAEGPQLVYRLRAETDREVVVVDNQVDLSLVVRDSLGRPLTDAQVAVAGQPLPFDAITQSYRQVRGGRAGLVAVTQAGRTTFHPLAQPFADGQARARVGAWLVRAGRRVLYGSPLGYLTRPVWQLGYSLRHASYTTTGPVGLARSVFNEDVREERRGRREQRRQPDESLLWTSYVATSQPRYRPSGDTLHLKARVLRRRDGRPCRQPLTLWLGGSYNVPAKRIAVLRPSAPGSYIYTLPLSDTLGLRPNTYVGFRLTDAHDHTYASGAFQLEDYELKNTHYTLRMAEKIHRQGQPQAVFMRGTDVNDLNLLDARLQLLVTPSGEPGQLPGRQVFVPDTLWTTRQPLNAQGETRVELPAAKLPNVDLSYYVQGTFLTSDNERRSESAHVEFRREPGELRAELRGDSVHFEYYHRGQLQPHAATLRIHSATALRGDLFRGPVQLPWALRVDAQVSYYTLSDAAGRQAELRLTANDAALVLQSARANDSLLVVVDNPHQLPFWYYIYEGNKLRYRGYGPALQLAQPRAGKEPWFASLHYQWAGELRSAEYTMALPAPQLLVEAQQPSVAYPGQRIRLRFAVTDERGRPVPNADLTSYAYTSKFGPAPVPTLPVIRTARPVQGRLSRRRFQLADFEARGQQQLPWARWRAVLGLDSLRFYQFLYPETGAFYEYQPAPGGLTQVAPFVVDSGRVQPPVAVYIDGQPGYIRALNHADPYTVVADSGFHTISIRTATRLVTLHGVYLRHLHKLTFSVDVNQPCAELSVSKREPGLDGNELLALQRSIVVITNPELVNPTLRQGRVLRPVVPGGYQYAGGRASGPFRPDSVLLRDDYGFRRRFLFEPGFRYSLGSGVVKMQCFNGNELNLLTNSYYYNFSPLPLQGFAYTEADFKRPAYRLQGTTPVYFNPTLDEAYGTAPGHGRLQLRAPRRPANAAPTTPELPAMHVVLLTRPDQPKFTRLSWANSLLQDLPPGRYRVVVLLTDSTCLAPKELAIVQPNGQTYFQLQLTDRRPNGPLSRRINRLLWARTPRITLADKAERREIRIERPQKPQPGWRTLRGRVIDFEANEGLPGATIQLKGTTWGTATNADGGFSLQIPPDDRSIIQVRYLGYTSTEVAIGWKRTVDIVLQTDSKQLNEVVVTALGVPRESRSLGYSVSEVRSAPLMRGIAGKVPGVAINGMPGSSSRITIRGNSSLLGSNKPLIMLDGLPFDGEKDDIDPDAIASINVIKGEAAASLYGSQAAGGVIVITTKPGAKNFIKGTQAASLYGSQAADGTAKTADDPGRDPRLAMRRHFRDYAWWRPLLLTDAQGRASTEVVLPDDVTSWTSFVLASDDHGRVGYASGHLRSFKQLRAELAAPRFLIAGDRPQLVGKSLNYGFDTARVTTTFRLGQQALRTQAHPVHPVALDTLTITAPAALVPDSVQLSFALARDNGYQDGEQQRLPLLPAGSLERVGTFAPLVGGDTTLVLPINPALGPLTVRLESDPLPALLREIEHLQQYPYLCNEQAASKLKALLLEKRIRAAQQLPFRGEKDVHFLIKKLLDGRQPLEYFWGTWRTSPVSAWATLHVLEALMEAEKAGYPVALNRGPIQTELLRQLDESLSAPAVEAALKGHPLPGRSRPADDLLRLLSLLHQLGTPADYATYVARYERLQAGRQPLDRYLALMGLRQQLGLPYQLDTLRRYRLRTQLGGVFYDDTLRPGSYYSYLLRQQVGVTLLAYRLLRTQGGHTAELARLRAGLLQLRQDGSYWTSTYEAAQILETIGPDLVTAGQPAAFARAELSGSLSQTVTKFPFTTQLPATAGPLTLRKEGSLPLYATAYQSYWDPAPPSVSKAFTVRTTLAGQGGTQVRLRAGQPTELLVTVDVKAAAHYVLLEVPIPAGCSYGEPAAPHYLEVHREYLRHQTSIFLDHLPVGRHTFRIALQPRYHGRYTLNPAKAELVYFPTQFGRSASKQAVVD